MAEPKFYTFDQNNSGGYFDHDPDAGIGYRVCIQAHSAVEANALAERIGLYFNGCGEGRDCDCCGDRWNAQWIEEGSDTPEYYGQPLRGGRGYPSYIHYLDGRVEAVPDEERQP